MKSIQPYFVISTLHYKKRIAMKRGIAHFYNFFQDSTDLINVAAVPDGCVDILFEKDNSGFRGRVCGTVLENTIIDNKNDKEYFGIRFLPGVLPIIVNASMPELVEKQIDINDIIVDKELIKQMEDATSMEEIINRFLRGYDDCLIKKSIINKHDNKLKMVEFVKNEIINSNGTISIEEAARNTGYTTRYINQLFNEYIGINPKTFSKIIKFQNVIQAINNNSSSNLTDLGLDTGYYDQSHFIKDFKKYAALTPTEYRMLIMQHDYNHRLEIMNV